MNAFAKQMGVSPADMAKAQETLNAVRGAAAENPNFMSGLQKAAQGVMPGQASTGLLSADNALAVKSLVEAGFSKETAVFMVTGQSLPPMSGGRRRKTRKAKKRHTRRAVTI